MKRRMDISLLTLIAQNALAATEFPSELKLLNWGTNTTRKGVVKVGTKTFNLLPIAQKEMGYDRVALDFEHNTVPGTAAYKETKPPRDIAAHGVPQVRLNDGLYMVDLVWTPIGKEKKANFPDLSPAVQQDEDGEVVFLHSSALCLQGAVDELHSYSVDLTAEVPSYTPRNQDEETQIMEKILSLLRKGLGLNETATDEDIAKAMQTAQTYSAKLAEIEKGLTTLTAEVRKGSGNQELTLLTAKIAELEKNLKTFNLEIEKRDRDDICAQARREGKVVPLSVEQIASTPVATLREMVSKLASTVPIDQRTPDNVRTLSVDGSGSLSEADKKIAAQCGFTEDEVKKANGLK